MRVPKLHMSNWLACICNASWNPVPDRLLAHLIATLMQAQKPPLMLIIFAMFLKPYILSWVSKPI